MKLRILTIVGMGLAALAVHAADGDKPQEKSPFKNQREKVSYSLGVNYGTSWKNQEVDVDLEMLTKGLRDALAGKESLLTEKEIRETLNAYGAELRAKAEEKRKVLGEKNKQEGEAFLAENKKKSGVITTPSGLQYKVIKEGSGPIPKSTDEVTVHYRGTLIDGMEFDSSNKSTNVPTFRVTGGPGGLIKGWIEALQLMKVGSKWQLFVPADLAYSQFGRRPNIGPNATLLFDLELLSTKPTTNAPPQSFGPGQTFTAPKTTQPAVTSDIIKVPSAEELKKGAKIEVIKADTLEKKGEINPATKPDDKPEKK